MISSTSGIRIICWNSTLTRSVTLWTNGKNITHFPVIKFDQENIRYAIKIKYLGVIIDQNLAFITHFNYLKYKLYKMNYNINHMNKATRVIRLDNLDGIYKLIYEKVIVYDSTTWYNGSARLKVKVLQLRRAPLLGITKCYRNVASE